LCFDIANVPLDQYKAVRKAIACQFHLIRTNQTVGLDETIATYAKQGSFDQVGIEWDIWSGFTVVAHKPNSEVLVESIATFLIHVLPGMKPAHNPHTPAK
jgi:hypothetical protein